MSDSKKKRSYTDFDVKLAMHGIFENKMSLVETSKKFGIPRTILYDLKRTKRDTILSSGPQPVFSKAEEEDVLKIIQSADRRSLPITKKNLIEYIQRIFQEESEKDIGKWVPNGVKIVRNFLKRHPGVELKTAEAIVKNRAQLSGTMVEGWFEELREFISEEGLREVFEDSSRVFNMEETGFSSVEVSSEIISLNWDWKISMLLMISANGTVIPPMIIYPDEKLSETLTNNLPTESQAGMPYIVGQTPNGCVSSDALYEYLVNMFDQWLTINNIKRPILLFTEWHEMRVNVHLLKKLKELNIIMYGLFRNDPHLLQPIDLSVIFPLKKQWSTVVSIKRENPDEIISIFNFASILFRTFKETVNAKNIVAGFCESGLFPFNPCSRDYLKEVGTMTDYIESSEIIQTETFKNTLKQFLKETTGAISYGSLDDDVLFVSKLKPLREYYYIFNSISLKRKWMSNDSDSSDCDSSEDSVKSTKCLNSDREDGADISDG